MLHPITEHKGLLLTSAFKMNSFLSSSSNISSITISLADLCVRDPVEGLEVASRLQLLVLVVLFVLLLGVVSILLYEH